jgi:hypothetical protein
MALIKVNRFEDIGVTLSPETKTRIKGLGLEKAAPKVLSLDDARELRDDIKPAKVENFVSDEKWGLYLKRFSLNQNFEFFLTPQQDNEIFFTSFAWDYNGEEPVVYPPKGVDLDAYKFKIKPQGVREFLGDGVNLRPPRKVAGALNLAIIVYEHDGDVRHLGETLIKIHDAVGNSTLTSIITAIPSPAVIPIAVGPAVLELIDVIGGLMAGNENDWVDTLQGSWGTDKEQEPGPHVYNHDACSVELELTIS